jgi:hypothetical protein
MPANGAALTGNDAALKRKSARFSGLIGELRRKFGLATDKVA